MTARGAPTRMIYLCLQPLVDGEATATHVAAIANGLRRRSWDVDVIAPSRSLDVSPIARVSSWGLGSWRVARRLRDADVCYVRTHVASLPIALLARLRRRTVAQELNGTWEEAGVVRRWSRPLMPLVKRSFATQLKAANLVIAVTPQLDVLARSCGARNVVTIENGADTELFRPGLPRPSEAPAGPYALFFGSLAPWQGLEVLLAATRQDAWPEHLRLVVIGRGQLEAEVAREAARNPTIRVIGRVAHEQIAPWVANAVATGILKQGQIASAGFSPLKLYESMAAGTPTVVSDVPGLADTVRRWGCGLVVDPSDPAAVASAFATIASDAEAAAAMGAAGRHACVAKYSWDAAAGRTEAALAETVPAR